MSKTTKAREKAKQHDAAEDLILRLLGLLLDFGNFDPYWFCVSQGDLRPEHLLSGGRVYSSVVDAVIEELAALLRKRVLIYFYCNGFNAITIRKILLLK